MSILICVTKPDRVLLGVDTEGVLPDGSHGHHFSKLIPIVHLNAAVAGRGSAEFLHAVASRCLLGGSAPIEFVALANMPTFLREESARFRPTFANPPPEFAKLISGQEIIFAGWSEALHGPFAIRYTGDILDTSETWERTEITVNNWAVSPPPWGVTAETPPTLNNVDDLARVARAQVARVRVEAPEGPAGGKFILANITRTGMHITPVCDLDDDTPNHAGAAGRKAVPGVLV